MNFDLVILVTAELLIILALYRTVFRKWVIDKWEDKIQEEGYLVIKLEPVIDEIEDRIHEKLQQFQDSFFGSVGNMVKKGKDLDPMNNIRKAAKQGDWTSMLVEYAANKSGLGALLPSDTHENRGKTAEKTPLVSQKTPKPKRIRDIF
jgi:hypothetical protein|tara:strand:- start:16 stop:459 length:444 start_codon:yes stop_codon:yes gene_type:complete